MDATNISSNTNTKSESEKTAEFRRLFYFFEKLSQPRPRSSRDPEDAFIPQDLAPLLNNLSSILKKDAPEDFDPTDESSRSPTPTLHPSFALPQRPRRNTMATTTAFPTSTTAPPKSSASPSKSQACFPLGHKRYPFTFKMMLHKLYDLEDWAAKVRDVVATSQEQYRPLEACVSSSSSSCSPSSPGLYSPPTSPTFSETFAPTPTHDGESSSPSPARRRAATVSQPKDKKAQMGAVLGLGPPPRALKKRIVDRRKSVSEPFENGVAHAGGWVYEAAVSSVDVDAAPRRALEEPRRKRVVSSVSFREEEKRIVGRNVSNMGKALEGGLGKERQVQFVERRARKRSFVEV